ncbi:MAG: glycoside hydrolase family 13 protein [bacterium]
MSRLVLILFAFWCFSLSGQVLQDLRVEPPFWWTGFKHPHLQIMIHGLNISNYTVSLNYPGVTVNRVDRIESPNYLFLTLAISPDAVPGTFPIRFLKEKAVIGSYLYELKQRDPGSRLRKGFSASDVIYLMTPDRFANGDTANDNLPSMREKVDRTNPNGRHGGDIQGGIDHLDYLEALGVTALWINPLLENNMERYSYHGYSTTDYYKTDPRFGSNEDYVRLADSLHRRGMKLIMDMIFNHCGSAHWWMADLPSADWINAWPEFTRSSYRAGTVSDPYASPSDSVKFIKGWFDQTMPDLNQHNPFLKNYLIQNSLWWIEYAKLDGIRQDTHPYPFKDMMAEWGKRVLDEYPDFNIVGECWMNFPSTVAYWQKDTPNKDGYNSNLPSVFDFPMYDVLRVAFSEPEGWNTGIVHLYDILSQDGAYPNPMNLVIFADNHDVNRYLDTQRDDVRKLKMAIAFVLTTRGIPQIFYGTELLMTTGEDEGHGSIRKDVIGGWPGDSRDAFTKQGRTPQEQDMYTYLQTILQWRKTKPVIHSGNLRHYIPQDGVYVYFRYNASDTVMVVLNNNDEVKTLDTGRFSDFLKGQAKGTEIITGQTIHDLRNLVIPGKSVLIIEFTD